MNQLFRFWWRCLCPLVMAMAFVPKGSAVGDGYEIMTSSYDVNPSNESGYAVWVREPDLTVPFLADTFYFTFPLKLEGDDIVSTTLILTGGDRYDDRLEVPLAVKKTNGSLSAQVSCSSTSVAARSRVELRYGKSRDIENVYIVRLSAYVQKRPYQTVLHTIRTSELMQDKSFSHTCVHMVEDIDSGRWTNAIHSIETLLERTKEGDTKCRSALEYLRSRCIQAVQGVPKEAPSRVNQSGKGNQGPNH